MASHTSIHQFTAHYHTMLRCSVTSFLLLLLSSTTFSHGLSLATHAPWQPQPPAGSNTASCIREERDALLAFKQGITSDPEGDLASWNEDQEDCCRWRGVRCSNTTGHVLKLRLRDTHADPYGDPITPLVGQISQSLLALERLEYLDLSSNHLEGTTGRIPEFLGSLKNLKYLNLSGIMFSDKVPSQLGNLSNLQYLDLSGMDGTYSTDVSWLTRLSFLQYLSLDSVELRIKDDWPRVVNMLPSLRVIVLSNCRLSSATQSLGALNLTNLQELDVSYNFFNHPVASCWFWNLTSLTYLDLGSNYLLYGQLPNALGDMTLLRYLSLSDMKTSVSMIMARLNNLCNLRILYLDSCFTQGNIVDLIEMLPQCSLNKLQLLSLESNQLTGALPKVMEQLTNLVVLDLSGNNITGPVPAFIRSMAGLVLLDLSSNKMEGPIPKFIGQFTSLRTLDLSNNHLNGSVPEEPCGYVPWFAIFVMSN
ncbi:hypothetical protein QOZ80_9BG0711430 [Eleusine coracana subsp. coracana]|nr:hypothetical protein QOZ80_9BG0711430 [Eleusine coracana subsp. coracana]